MHFTTAPSESKRRGLRSAVRSILAAGLILSPLAAATAQSRHYFLIPDNDDYQRYKGALSRFPDLRACKDEGFLKAGQSFHDLHSVFGTREELELCHYWLFAGASDPKQAIVEYFSQIEGMQISTPFSALPGRVLVEARWDSSAHGIPFGGYLRRKTAEQLSYAASLMVTIQGDRITRVDMGFASK